MSYFDRKPDYAELRHNLAYVGLAGWCWYVWSLVKEAQGDFVGGGSTCITITPCVTSTRRFLCTRSTSGRRRARVSAGAPSEGPCPRFSPRACRRRRQLRSAAPKRMGTGSSVCASCVAGRRAETMGFGLLGACFGAWTRSFSASGLPWLPYVGAPEALAFASIAGAFLHDAFCAVWLCAYMGARGRCATRCAL